MAPFFTELAPLKGFLYLCATIYVISTTLAVCTKPFLTLPCDYDGSQDNLKFGNVLFEYNPWNAPLVITWSSPSSSEASLVTDNEKSDCVPDTEAVLKTQTNVIAAIKQSVHRAIF